MSTPFLYTQNWRELYRAALFETDSEKLVNSITVAQRALIQRARELFLTPSNNLEEEQAIDDALRALRALHRCLQPGMKKH